MSYPSYQDIKISTMVVNIDLDQKMNLVSIFNLVPVTPYTPPTPLSKRKPKAESKTSRKLRLPTQPEQGAVYSISYCGQLRGLLRSTKSSKIEHSVLMDLGLKEKCVNVRVTEKNLNICGIKSYEQIKDTLYELFDVFDFIHRQLEKIPSIGSDMMKYIDEHYSTMNDALMEASPEPELCRYFMSFSVDYQDKDLFMTKIKWIVEEAQPIYENEIKVKNRRIVLLNHNFSLGFPVSRLEVARLFSEQKGFIGQFNNARDHKSRVLCFIDKDKSHKFIISKNGSILLTSPDPETVEDAYDQFISIVQANRERIERQPIS